jgi:hypothetical protein
LVAPSLSAAAQPVRERVSMDSRSRAFSDVTAFDEAYARE